MKQFLIECGWIFMAVLLAVLYTSVFHSLPVRIHLPLLSVLLLLMTGFRFRAFEMAFLFGLLLDAHSLYPFGIYTSMLVGICLIIDVIRTIILKQFALYALAVHGLIAIMLYYGFELLASFSFARKDLFAADRWLGIPHDWWWEGMLSFIVLVAVSAGVVVASRKLFPQRWNYE